MTETPEFTFEQTTPKFFINFKQTPTMHSTIPSFYNSKFYPQVIKDQDSDKCKSLKSSELIKYYCIKPIIGKTMIDFNGMSLIVEDDDDDDRSIFVPEASSSKKTTAKTNKKQTNKTKNQNENKKMKEIENENENKEMKEMENEKRDRIEVAACRLCNPNRDKSKPLWFEIPDDLEEHYFKVHTETYHNIKTMGHSMYNFCDRCHNMYKTIEDARAHKKKCVKEGWVEFVDEGWAKFVENGGWKKVADD